MKSHRGIGFGVEVLPGGKDWWRNVAGFNQAGQGQKLYSFYS